jgi:hypothetical protein
MADDFQYDVLLSHSAKDERLAQRVVVGVEDVRPFIGKPRQHFAQFRFQRTMAEHHCG